MMIFMAKDRYGVIDDEDTDMLYEKEQRNYTALFMHKVIYFNVLDSGQKRPDYDSPACQ